MNQNFERLTHYAFIDFEASSLESNSWPIEVGVSKILESGKVETWSSLIMRHASWLPERWSPASEKVHGIPFLELDKSPSAETVWQACKRQIDNRLVVADAPKFEEYWLGRLMSAADQDPDTVSLIDYHELAFSLFDGLDLDRVYEFLETHRAPHRAGPDSRRLARAMVNAVKNRDRPI